MVGGRTIEECKENLEAVFKRLKEKNLQINPEKCVFFKTSVKYLGHVLCADGIKQDPDKIAATKDFPVPKTLKDLRGFLGLASYYRKFTNNFATVAAPLTDITKGFKVGKR